MKSKYLVSQEVQSAVSHVYGSRLHGALSRKVFTLATTFDKGLAEFLKSKNDLQQEYVSKDENGNPMQKDGNYIIPDDKLEEFNSKYNDLLETEFPVKRLDIEDVEEVPSISAKEIKTLIDAGLVRN